MNLLAPPGTKRPRKRGRPTNPWKDLQEKRNAAKQPSDQKRGASKIDRAASQQNSPAPDRAGEEEFDEDLDLW